MSTLFAMKQVLLEQMKTAPYRSSAGYLHSFAIERFPDADEATIVSAVKMAVPESAALFFAKKVDERIKEKIHLAYDNYIVVLGGPIGEYEAWPDTSQGDAVLIEGKAGWSATLNIGYELRAVTEIYEVDGEDWVRTKIWPTKDQAVEYLKAAARA